jgi:hypothetical protein
MVKPWEDLINLVIPVSELFAKGRWNILSLDLVTKYWFVCVCEAGRDRNWDL